MSFSSAGRRHLAALGVILLVNNEFQEFFFVADMFPLALSIVTLVLLILAVFLDAASQNSFAGRPPFLIGMLSVLSILWLAFNAFSTSRWREVPLSCGSIPIAFAAEQSWCKDLQALKAFVWVEWLLVTGTLLFTVLCTLAQHSHGQTHVWSMPLSRYKPYQRNPNMAYAHRSSSFFDEIS